MIGRGHIQLASAMCMAETDVQEDDLQGRDVKSVRYCAGLLLDDKACTTCKGKGCRVEGYERTRLQPARAAQLRGCTVKESIVHFF